MYRRLPLVPRIYRIIRLKYLRARFPGSKKYWDFRYAMGGTSGRGSYGKLAEFKAQVLNCFVKKYDIHSVIEFGCGDGNQLELATYLKYIGLDVSKTAVKICKERFQQDKTKSFFLYDPVCFDDKDPIFKAELALSLDVIFHLVEDRIFKLYMSHLFASSVKSVIIYSSDTDDNPIGLPHVRHRNFTKWVKENLPNWKLINKVDNKYPLELGSFADFYFYKKSIF